MTTTAPPGLRERKKLACRAALVDAAQALVARDGLDGVTVEQICAETGVSARTFFNYFESKDDAVLGVEPMREAPQAGAVFAAGGPSGDHLADLGTLLSVMLAARTVDRERMSRAMSLTASEPRLLARQMVHIEQKNATMAGLLSARLGQEPQSPSVHALVILAGALARASFARWHADGDVDLQAAIASTIDEFRAVLSTGVPPPVP